MTRRRIPDQALRSVMITDELSNRVPTPIDGTRVNEGLKRLSAHIEEADSKGLLKMLTEVTVDLCKAGSAGLSVLETQEDGTQILRWVAMSGALASSVGGSTPRDCSPSGIALNKLKPQLFKHPHRCFKCFADTRPPIVEDLVVPLMLNSGEEFGTLWIATHDDQRKFTASELEVMRSLCSFTMAAARILGVRPRDKRKKRNPFTNS